MKIAIILPSLKNTGPIIVAHTIVKLLKNKDNISFDVFYFDNDIELEFDCKITQIGFKSKIPFNEYDIIHTHTIRPLLYMVKNRKFFKGKHISTIHNYVHKDLYYLYNIFISIIITPFYLWLFKKTNILIAINKNMTHFYKKILFKKDIFLIYNTLPLTQTKVTINEEDSNKLTLFKKNRILIGTVSILTGRKGIDQLLKAIYKNPKYCICIIGDGKERKILEKMVSKLNINNNVLFLGYKQDAINYIKYFDIFAMPSRSEGFGIALIEAASLGIPSITSNIPVFKELFPTEVVHFKLNNINDLKQKIDFLYQNKNKYSELIKNKYLKEFNPDLFAERHYFIYNQLVNYK